MMNQAPPAYRHTQTGPWLFVLYPIGLFMLGLGWWLWLQPEVPAYVSVVVGAGGVILLFLGPCFHNLTVVDEGDCLALRFGWVPLWQKRIRYDRMRSVQVDQTTLLDGWGVHPSLRGGVVWNVWGWDCVAIDHDGITRVGTDDATNLAAFLNTKIHPPAHPHGIQTAEGTTGITSGQ
jgi:hypothetical protein